MVQLSFGGNLAKWRLIHDLMETNKANLVLHTAVEKADNVA
jgi:hypothetical protein